MPIKVEKITEPVTLGEGPHWDARQQALFFVDIAGRTINKYVPATGSHTSTNTDGPVSFIVPVEGTADQFLLGSGLRLVIVCWDGASGSPASLVRVVGEVEQGTPNKLNDGKADPRGRIYTGTIGPEVSSGNFQSEQGSVYRVDGTKITQLGKKITISNGLAWDLEQKAFYYIDSMERKIRRYDYDVETGDVSNLKYIFDLEKINVEGFPDGMTIDSDGNLWVAIFNGSAVFKIDPRTGDVLQKVPIPALQVTSVAFGGPNYSVLFVTTANIVFGGPKPPGGSTYMVTGLGVRGLPNRSYKP